MYIFTKLYDMLAGLFSFSPQVEDVELIDCKYGSLKEDLERVLQNGSPDDLEEILFTVGATEITLVNYPN